MIFFVILLAWVCLLLGFGAGIFVGTVRADRRAVRAIEDAQVAIANRFQHNKFVALVVAALGLEFVGRLKP